MKAKTGFTWAHRGNSNLYAEHTMNAYQNAVSRGHVCLEYSMARTSDGVWFGLHDADINRTSGLAAGTLPPVTVDDLGRGAGLQINALAKDGIPSPYLPLGGLPRRLREQVHPDPGREDLLDGRHHRDPERVLGHVRAARPCPS